MLGAGAGGGGHARPPLCCPAITAPPHRSGRRRRQHAGGQRVVRRGGVPQRAPVRKAVALQAQVVRRRFLKLATWHAAAKRLPLAGLADWVCSSCYRVLMAMCKRRSRQPVQPEQPARLHVCRRYSVCTGNVLATGDLTL